jgi:DNA-binding FadR family transcriptional regulator
VSEPAPTADRADLELVAPTMLEPVRSANVFEETVERVLQMVKLGLVLPGQRLPAERELARRFGVSRPTVREAIRALVHTGYLETRRGRQGGAVVVEWVPEPSSERARAVVRAMGTQLSDVLDLREVVEPGAAALAARRMQPGDEERLDEALAALAGAPRVSFPVTERPVYDGTPSAGGDVADRPLSYRFADYRLHLTIGDLTRAASVSAAVVQIQVRLSDLMSHTPQMQEVLLHSDEQHDAIVAAIKARDPDAARAAMEQHVAATSSYVRGFLA